MRGNFFSTDVMQTVMENLNTSKNKNLLSPLSTREIEILQLIANEMTTQEIADKLFLSPLTVETHRKNILLKLGVRNTARLIKFALKNKLIE